MITTNWFDSIPAILVGVIVVFVPGLIALFANGLRGLSLFAFAPVFGVAATAAAALLFGQVGIPWSVLSWALAMVVLAGIAWLVGRLVGRSEPAPEASGRRWVLWAGILLGVTFAAWRLISYIGDPGGISQTNDAVFHMNAVRHALETADVSSLHLNAVIGGRSFYPAAWHAITVLTVLMTGASIPVSANAITLVIGALIWPLGLAWLARSVFSSNAVAGITAVLASALQAFPLLMFQWGVLFPNALSTALIPAGVAVVVSGTKWLRRGSAPWRQVTRLLLFVAVTVSALLLAQPAAFLPWAAMSLVWLSAVVLLRRKTWGTWRAAAVLSASWVSLAIVWLALAQGTSGSHWPPFRGKLEVLLDVFFNGQVRMPFAFAVSALMLIGLVAAVRRPNLRWFVGAWAGISLLYVLVAAIGNPFVRESILGAWYADPYRLTALAPIVVIPLAAFGLHSIVRWSARRLRLDADGLLTAAAGLIVSAVILVLIILFRSVAMPAFLEGTFDRESRYVAAEDAFLSPDERAVLEELSEHVPPGARVLGNPSAGTAFGYFLSGVDVYPRTWSPPRTEPWAVIAAGLRDAASEPEVCEALEVYGHPEYVLDFGPSEAGPGKFPAAGMTEFQDEPGFELVFEHGDASLWRITACAR